MSHRKNPIPTPVSSYQQDSPQYSLCYPGQLPPAALAYVVRAAGSHRKAGDRNRQPRYRLKGSVDIQIGQGAYGNVHTTEHQADNIGSQHPPSVLGPGGPPAEVGILANTSPDRVLQGHHWLARGYRLAALVAPGRICMLAILPVKRRFIHLGLTTGARALLPGLPTGAAFLKIL